MGKRLTKEQKTEIIRLYNEDGISPKKISEMFGIKNNSVTRIMRKEGGGCNQLQRVSNETIIEIIDMYKNGISSELIANNFNIAGTTVCRILTRNNIEIRPATQNKRQYKINEDYFENIDTERKAYFLGLLYADGNLSSRKSDNRVSIILHEKDRHILVELSNDIYGFEKIHQDGQNNKGEKYLGVAIYSKKMHSDLSKLGCTPQKSFTITFPSFDIVPKELIWHFIRGFMDGDGCICTKESNLRTRIDFTANKDFIIGLRDFFANTLGLNINQRIEPNKENEKTHNIQYSSDKDINMILDEIYKDATIFLTRKKEKYLEAISFITKKVSKKTDKYTDISKYGTTFIPEFNGKILTSENVKLMTEEEKVLATEMLSDFYREHGFPYPTLTPDELLKHFMHLANTNQNTILKEDNILSINNQNGLPIFKHFSPHFFDVKSGKRTSKLSMVETFENDDLLKKVIKNRLDQGFNMTGNMLKQGLANSRIAYQASIFNPTIAKYIYSKYTKEGDIIYDYSMGFGQRLIAALSLPYKIKYIGVDPLLKTVQSNQNIFNFFNVNRPMLNKDVELICTGAEDYCDENYFGKVKLAFSSPPYWNIEKYSNDIEQSTILDYTDFINKWWRKVVNNISKLLMDDGIFILNIVPQIRPFEIKEDMCNILISAGFNIIEEYKMQLTRNTNFANRNGEHKYEPIIVFKRK